MSEDVLGNQIRQHGFLLYSTFSGINDFERQENSTALLELAVWMREQIGAEVQTTIGDKTYSGEIIRISAENGMLYAVPQENNIDGMQYQLQITARYTVEF